MSKDDTASNVSANSGLTSRRSVLTALAAVPVASVPALATATIASAGALASHPDAELLRLGAEFDRLHAAWLPLNKEVSLLNDVFMSAWQATGLSSYGNVELWIQRGEECGLGAAQRAEELAFNLLDAVTNTIRETPAKTFAGLAIKARALRFNTHLDTQCHLPEQDQDWQEFVMNKFVAEVDRLASATFAMPAMTFKV